MYNEMPEMTDNPNVRVAGCRYILICQTCGHSYGVALLANGKLPNHWDYCMSCANQRKQTTKEYFEKLNQSDSQGD